MDIEGVGEQFVRRLWDRGPRCARCPTSTGSPPSGSRSSRATGRSRPGTPSRRSRLSRQQPFSRVLFGLNIPDVGWVTAQNLARHFGRSTAARRGPGGDPGGRGHRPRARRGDRGVVRGRAEPGARGRAAELGLKLRDRRGRAAGRGPARPGRTYVITGTLERYTREEAEAALEALGAKVADAVSKKTTASSSARSPGVEGREGAEGRRAAADEAALKDAARRVGCRAASRREAVLGLARPVSRDRAAVLEHGEDVAAADEPGERAGGARRPRLRDDVAARRGARSRSASVPSTPATASEPRNASRILGMAEPAWSSATDRRAVSRSRLERPRAVDDADAAERDPGGGSSSARRAPPPRSCHGRLRPRRVA